MAARARPWGNAREAVRWSLAASPLTSGCVTDRPYIHAPPGRAFPRPRAGATGSLAAIDQHRVAVAEEAISLGDGVGVGAADVVDAGEGAHQHEQRGARQVEVRDQAVDRAEAVARQDEETGVRGTGHEPFRPARSGRL